MIKPIARTRMGRRRSKITVRKLARKVKKLETDRDYNTHDVNYSGTVDTSGTLTLLNGISQGDAYNNRAGNKINVKSISLRGYMTVADTYNIMRVVLFVDNQANLAAPAVADLLEQPANAITSNFLAANRKRFRILFDQNFTMSTDEPIISFPKFYKKMALPVNYNGSASTIAAIAKNSIYLYVVSDSNAVNHPSAAITSRIRFVD